MTGFFPEESPSTFLMYKVVFPFGYCSGNSRNTLSSWLVSVVIGDGVVGSMEVVVIEGLGDD
jgi:hypothetical protein